jgi:uncharacterized RDD family membrane protein YckC
MTHLRIRTPEGVEFSLPIAGPVSRALAYLVDFLLVVAADSILAFGLSLMAIVSRDLSEAFLQIGFFVLPIVYGVLSEWLWRGQTVGKRLFNLRVVDAEGLKLRPSQLLLRNLLRAVDFLPLFYLVGGVTTLLNRKGQRLGDLAAGTVVIRLQQSASPDLEPLLGGRFNSLRSHPHLAARLRQRIPAGEAAVALQALVRRDELESSARVTLFRELADDFRSQVAFPPDVAEALTDEQYVRNVVDLLYRPKVGTNSTGATSSAGP